MDFIVLYKFFNLLLLTAVQEGGSFQKYLGVNEPLPGMPLILILEGMPLQLLPKGSQFFGLDPYLVYVYIDRFQRPCPLHQSKALTPQVQNTDTDTDTDTCRKR
jgi:hypothetical protein